jgi:hypothetical protein
MITIIPDLQRGHVEVLLDYAAKLSRRYYAFWLPLQVTCLSWIAGRYHDADLLLTVHFPLPVSYLHLF